MKTIGQFAKDNNITVKTLHHYEKLGLLYPMHVDQDNGYRYYKEEQGTDIKIIMFLKQLGFSLSEVQKVMNESYSDDRLKSLFEQKVRQVVQDKASISQRHHKLNTVLNILHDQENNNITYKELISMSEKTLFTGKYGRGMFIEASEKAFEEARINNTPFSVVQLDLDHFHQVNKTYGHDIGDIVLERTQEELIAVLQEVSYDSLFERRGGDEFSISISASPKDTAMLMTKAMNRITKLDFSDVADDLNITITAGISGLTDNTNSYSELVQEALIKLYEMKRNK